MLKRIPEAFIGFVMGSFPHCHWMGQAPVAPTPSPGPESASTTLMGPAGQQAKANAELLSEIYRVVLLSEPKGRSSFGNFVDSMNQGASLEGVYNGFVHSSLYREAEQKFKGHTPAAMNRFIREMIVLLRAEQHPVGFFNEDAEPLPTPVDLSQPPPAGAPPLRERSRPELPKIEELIAQHLRQIFANASFFTLKRVLGDEVLKVLDEMKSDPKLRAQWYATQVVRMMEYQVNFGLALRNRPDFIFHRGWAETVSPDRLCWELLNREHRLLNQAQNGAGL